MSRLEFRAAVDAPRPAAAWLMVSTASVTLWITYQLELWAVLAQAGAIVGSLALRRHPHPWQRDPIALNLGMFGVVAATVAVALRGQPSTIALAHFAALAQGLQLLDTRPRRSEFLLVAVALFQVLLASSLTDNVWFVPLLGCFVVATAWTLIVHTLRTEALEAGQPGAVTKAITPGLLRTTFLASAASIVVGLGLFPVLPRMQSSLTRAGPLGAEGAVAGFSDHVQLGDLGRIRQDSSVVMRIETLEGDAPARRGAYWRGLAFDTFDGRSWSVTPRPKHLLARSAELGVGLSNGSEPPNLVQRIVREPVVSGVIFREGEPRTLRGSLHLLERDVNGGLYARTQSQERVSYTVSSRRHAWSEAELRNDRAIAPPTDGRRYLTLPPLDPGVAQLAQRIVAGRASDAARARAIERYLLRNGRYTDTPPPIDPHDGHSPVEAFLFGAHAGHCEYFATAMVVLARAVGIPSRLVNGFAGGETNRIGGFVELTRSDAHAWVEVHFEKAGWVRYDPTPPDLRLRAGSLLSWRSRLRWIGSAVELWWFQRVVDFDRSDQLRALRAGWLAWRRLQPVPVQAGDGSSAALAEGSWVASWTLPLLLIAGFVGALVTLSLRRLGRRRYRIALPGPYARALRLLERRGFSRAPSATAWDFASQVRASVPSSAAAAFEGLTRAYLQERFGGRAASRARLEYQRFRQALRRKPVRPRRIRRRETPKG